MNRSPVAEQSARARQGTSLTRGAIDVNGGVLGGCRHFQCLCIHHFMDDLRAKPRVKAVLEWAASAAAASGIRPIDG
jgi:hypothetical protein